MYKTILPCLAAFTFLLAPLWAHARDIQLQQQLADDELLSTPDSITASLYTAPDAGDPVAVQTYYQGEWQLAGEGAARSLRLSLDAPGMEQQELWYELEADGLLIGERQVLRAPPSGVTLAAGNRLDMDSNVIINLVMPAAPGDGMDAANRAYVDNADIAGNAATATELAADGANCPNGEYPLGVDKTGAVQGCTPDVTDNLGDHVATQNLQLGPHWLSGDGGNEGMRIDADGKVGINTAPSAANLQVGGADGLVVTGTHGSGVIPVEGAGSRLMWYPGKSAFRAGAAGSTEWDSANIGEYSTAMGAFNTASGRFSTTMGQDTTASGEHSTAMGTFNTASGDASTAMGTGTRAFGLVSTAMGWDTIANGETSTAMGYKTTASGHWSTAMGRETTASGAGSTAMGYKTKVSGNYSTAMGYGSTASAINSTSMGVGTTASAAATTAMGASTTASGIYSTAMGVDTKAESYAETVLGLYNTLSASPTPDSRVETDRLLVVGNGTSLIRSDAMVIQKNGRTTIKGLPATANGVSENAYVGVIENKSTNVSADVLALKIGTTGNPDTSSNFVGFFDGDTGLIGQIEGNGSGGVSYNTSGADYAEYLPMINPNEHLEAGDIVGVYNGRITRKTNGSNQVMVITDRPAVVGNAPAGKDNTVGYQTVSFIGQVPVKVRGIVNAGDVVIASGRQDGSGIALSVDAAEQSTQTQILGRAWESSEEPGLKKIMVAVGLDHTDLVMSQVRQLQVEVASLQQELQQYRHLAMEVADLKRQMASGSNLLTAGNR